MKTKKSGLRISPHINNKRNIYELEGTLNKHTIYSIIPLVIVDHNLVLDIEHIHSIDRTALHELSQIEHTLTIWNPNIDIKHKLQKHCPLILIQP